MRFFIHNARWAFAALVLLCGCSRAPDHVAGGDDYPNGVKPLAKHAAQERSDSSQWNPYQEAPTHPAGLYDSTAVPDSVPQAQAPTASDTFTVSIDSFSGHILQVHIRHTDSLRSVDSIVYQPGLGGSLIIRVASFTHNFTTGLENRYDYEDGDGDGFLSIRSQALNIAMIHLVTVLPSGTRVEKDVRLEAGADLNFNLHGDNRLLALETRTISGSDTLSRMVFQDVDGDGALFNPLRDSNQVDVMQKTRDPVSASQTTLSYRIMAFPDFIRNYPVRYHRVLTNPGGTEEVSALGGDSLPDFSAGDSGYAVVLLTPPTTDTLSQSHSVYRVLLANTAGRFQDNRLLSVDRIKTFRLGEESGLHFHLEPSTPVPPGGFARTGALTTRLDFKNGEWIQLQGEAATAEIFGVITNSQGRHGSVHIDFTGQVKSASGF